MAVLVVVFIPLDLWRGAEITARMIVEVILVSFGLFWIGMALEWSSYWVKRSKKAWREAEQ